MSIDDDDAARGRSYYTVWWKDRRSTSDGFWLHLPSPYPSLSQLIHIHP